MFLSVLMTLSLIPAAVADSITLDTGAVIEGDLARYEPGGDCQVGIQEGALSGVVLIVPCYRIQSFVRTGPVRPERVGSLGPTPATRAGPPTVLPAENPPATDTLAESSPAGPPTSGPPAAAMAPVDAELAEAEDESTPLPDIPLAQPYMDVPTAEVAILPAVPPTVASPTPRTVNRSIQF